MPDLARPDLTKFAEYGVRDGTTSTATLGLGAVELTRKFVVRWDQTGDLAKALLGYSKIQDGRLRRLLPAPHPRDPALVCTQLNLLNNHRFTAAGGADPDRPGGRSPADGGAANLMSDGSVEAQYAKAIVSAKYERPMYALLEDGECPAAEEYKRYVDRLPPVGGLDVLTIPGGGLNFVLAPGQTRPRSWGTKDSKPISYNTPLPVPFQELKVVWKRLPTDILNDDSPWQARLWGDPLANPAVLPFYSAVNKTAIFGRPPGTLQLMDVNYERRPAPFVQFVEGELTGGGALRYLSPAVELDITFVFRYRPQPWNWGYDQDPLPSDDPLPSGYVNRAGWYPYSRTRTYAAPGSTTDAQASPFHEREFRDLFKVTA